MGKRDLGYYKKYQSQLDYIKEYTQAVNASSGSKYDSNANVETKNVTTLDGELHKGAEIGLNRLRMINKITEMFGEDLAKEYIRQLEDHEIYRHDETHALFPYCVSVTLYPFILDGLKTLGAPSTEPKNLDSFCGNFINLVFAVAAQFAGAVATPEYLVYLDYFIRKEYGDDYYMYADDVVDMSSRKRTIKKIICDKFEQVAYSLNEPAAARNFQSVFWNISYYDKTYFSAIFEDFVFPDGDEPKWKSVSWLQKLHMKWFNAERARNYLTFPVESMNLVYDKETKEYKDEEWADFASEMWAEGHSFFCYNSDSADSLSSCCRLKNGITENVFSYTLGAGGISTGSKAVITTNINRLVQNAVRDGADISERVREQAQKNQKYLLAFNELLKDELNAGLLPIYDAGYISLEKQYLTQGINGFVEGAEFLGIDISPNEEYYKYGEMILRPIFEENRKARTKEVMFNTEFVPAENLGVKNAKWDRKDGYIVPRDCYNSYFYMVEDSTLSVIDKFMLHGSRLTKYLDGRLKTACYTFSA